MTRTTSFAATRTSRHSDECRDRNRAPRHSKGAATTMLTQRDPGYDQARAVWNAMVDRRPRIIARCATAGDVVRAICAARDRGLDSGAQRHGLATTTSNVSRTGVGGLTLAAAWAGWPGSTAWPATTSSPTRW